LLAEYKKPEDLLGPNGLLKRLTAALVEKALQTELTEHLGYEKTMPPVGVLEIRAMVRAPRR
jgi:transposase-like protein